MERMRRFNPSAWPSSPGWWCRFGRELATGDGAIPKEGGRAGGSSGATEPSPTEAPRGCVVHKPERARAEQREQHGSRGASRHGAKRVLVPADFNLMPHTLPVGLTDAREDRVLCGFEATVSLPDAPRWAPSSPASDRTGLARLPNPSAPPSLRGCFCRPSALRRGRR